MRLVEMLVEMGSVEADSIEAFCQSLEMLECQLERCPKPCRRQAIFLLREASPYERFCDVLLRTQVELTGHGLLDHRLLSHRLLDRWLKTAPQRLKRIVGFFWLQMFRR